MTDYTITTDFGAKDSLPSGNAAKVIKGSEFTTEFTNIKTAVNSKADSTGDTFTGAVTFDAAVTLNADVTFDTNTLFVDATNNRVGIGTTSPARTLHIKDSVAGIRLEDNDGTSYGEIIYNEGSNGLLIRSDENAADSGSNIIFEVDGSESARIDSSGRLLIGGTQVQTPSSIDNGVFIQSQTNNEVVGVNLYTNEASNNRRADFFLDDANGIYGMHSTASTGLPDFVIKSASAERFRVTDAGNVGIGTTSPDTLLELVGADPILTIRDSETTGANTNATLRLAESGASDTLGNYWDINHTGNGELRFVQDRDGVNNERMRIDYAGNVGIGTSNPANTLTVGNLEASSIYADATVGIKCDTNHKGLILQENSGAEQWSMGVNANGDLNFYDSAVTDPLVTFQDNSGNVGIGTTSPLNKLDVEATQDTLANVLSNGSYAAKFSSTTSGDTGRTQGILLSAVNANTRGVALLAEAQGSNNAHNFVIATSAASSTPTERMRIDSSGNLLVGRTSGSAADEDNGIVLSPTGFIYSAKEGTSAQTHIGFINNTDATATSVGAIRTSGSTTSYNTSSDERLKENITDSADAGSKIDAIQIRQFDWKSDGSHQDYGVIAQELINVAPEAVSEGDTEEDMMGVDYSKLVPMLIKEVQTLRNRVAQLENN